MRIELAHSGRVLAVALAACLMLPAGLRASTFSISDLTESTPTISDTNSTGRLSFSPTSCTGEATCFFIINFVPGTASFTLTFGGSPANAINLLEPGSQLVSDVLSLSDSSSQATFWQFSSDSETPLTAATGPSLIETGISQPTLVITYLNANQTIIGTDVINIQSDVPGVPEPSSGLSALIGLATLGITFLYRRAVSRIS